LHVINRAHWHNLLTFVAGAAVDWLQLFADADISTEVALAGTIGCSPTDLAPADMASIVGGVPLALQASCMRMVLSLYRAGLCVPTTFPQYVFVTL